jgi:hypothetical protein
LKKLILLAAMLVGVMLVVAAPVLAQSVPGYRDTPPSGPPGEGPGATSIPFGPDTPTGSPPPGEDPGADPPASGPPPSQGPEAGLPTGGPPSGEGPRADSPAGVPPGESSEADPPTSVPPDEDAETPLIPVGPDTPTSSGPHDEEPESPLDCEALRAASAEIDCDIPQVSQEEVGTQEAYRNGLDLGVGEQETNGDDHWRTDKGKKAKRDDLEHVFDDEEDGVVEQKFGDQEADSGDIEQELKISIEGDNNNQCVAVLQIADTGNVQNQQGVLQHGSKADDLEADGGEITVTPQLVQDCRQEIQQAAAANQQPNQQPTITKVVNKTVRKGAEPAAKTAGVPTLAANAPTISRPVMGSQSVLGRQPIAGRPAAAPMGQLPRTGGFSISGAALLGLSAGSLLIASGY